VGFNNLTKYFFTCWKFNKVCQLIPQPEGADAWKDFSPYFVMWLFGTVKSEQDSDRSIFTDLYTFGSDHLGTVVLFHSVLWMYETGSCTMMWNVEEASVAGIKLALYVPCCECVSPDMHHSSAVTLDGFLERGGVM